MKKLLIATIAVASLSFAGCSSVGEMKGGNTNTGVSLSQKNYRVIQTGATGKDFGFRLLFIPIVSPDYADAKANLYKSVGQTLTGRAIALANQTEDKSMLDLILFQIPRVMITADVIEFIDTASDNPPKPAP
jgi:hypothetical protein